MKPTVVERLREVLRYAHGSDICLTPDELAALLDAADQRKALSRGKALTPSEARRAREAGWATPGQRRKLEDENLHLRHVAGALDELIEALRAAA